MSKWGRTSINVYLKLNLIFDEEAFQAIEQVDPSSQGKHTFRQLCPKLPYFWVFQGTTGHLLAHPGPHLLALLAVYSHLIAEYLIQLPI